MVVDLSAGQTFSRLIFYIKSRRSGNHQPPFPHLIVKNLRAPPGIGELMDFINDRILTADRKQLAIDSRVVPLQGVSYRIVVNHQIVGLRKNLLHQSGFSHLSCSQKNQYLFVLREMILQSLI
ncbi:MAG: hypothetical protein UX06_C0042G0002 [Candidatus Giovannonibacteria bacterium GW2011_GWA2_45_21]|uniref:Uncharacterized protein n=1 Tax=Candidatus Giovannonibacteria bacterium GW2011_GWA2_45_21 TaxID=1618649 RepID=A0A0G1M516_9BACT|nr:MAG: hypothetical protein UX06_C0042G0002 [Candidatus Giovannonibacteria bacterium GW2011_GWA2_45_21]